MNPVKSVLNLTKHKGSYCQFLGVVRHNDYDIRIRTFYTVLPSHLKEKKVYNIVKEPFSLAYKCIRKIHVSRTLSSYTSSVSQDEVGKFEKMSGSWWDQSRKGQMKELHSMNRLRVPFIRDGILQQLTPVDIEKRANTPKPLEGFQILDIGCGGGILCEPLARLGAIVKGIDPGKENIIIARQHLPDELKENISYECTSIEDLASAIEENCKYDAVVISEVIEHIDSPDSFIRTATNVLKPGGSLFLTTINRTYESWVGAIVAWEYVLRKLPVGTHEWRKFLMPQEIKRIFKSCGLKTVLIHGMCYNPLNNTWKWSNQRTINYAVHALKN